MQPSVPKMKHQHKLHHLLMIAPHKTLLLEYQNYLSVHFVVCPKRRMNLFCIPNDALTKLCDGFYIDQLLVKPRTKRMKQTQQWPRSLQILKRWYQDSHWKLVHRRGKLKGIRVFVEIYQLVSALDDVFASQSPRAKDNRQTKHAKHGMTALPPPASVVHPPASTNADKPTQQSTILVPSQVTVKKEPLTAPSSLTTATTTTSTQISAVVKTENESQSSFASPLPATPSRRAKRVRWTKEEEEDLRQAVAIHGVGNWASIHRACTKLNPRRTPMDCKDKWRNMNK